MRMEQNFDDRIKAALDRECDGISASEDVKRRIDEAICVQQDGKQERRISMKHISVKKLCVGVAAACLLVSGVSVFAGRTDFFVSGAKTSPEYTDYRDMEKAQKELGYEVDSVERFENGYAFAGASVDYTTACSEENGEMYTFPSMDVRYRKDGKLIDLNVNEMAGMAMEGIVSKEADATRTCGDITLQYNEYTNKIVPIGYELTEEDKINEQRDDYNMTYVSVSVNGDAEEAAQGGSEAGAGADDQEASDEVKRGSYYVSEDGGVSVAFKGSGENESWTDWAEGGEPCVQQVKIVSWEKDGKYYDLSGTDLDLSADELFDMAEEILEGRQAEK